jgi:hypothetical protein
MTCVKLDKFRKVYSDGALAEVDIGKILQNKRSREAEDLYGGIVNDFNPYEEGDEGGYSSYSEEEFEESPEEKCPEKPSKVSSENINNIDLFNNISQKQLGKLNEIVENLTKEKKGIIIRAYKSKLKSKYTHLYEENSKQTENKTKFKIFHKCNFPNCNRTFASAGWLNSHFDEHTQEIDSCKFNKLFEIMKKYF